MTHPSTKNILIDKIARVEGNGGIEIEILDNKTKSVRMKIFEGPRLVEELIKGKSIDETISIVPRICAICNLSHKFASITAFQQATSTKPSDHAFAFYKLMHMGEMIESHTLHIYLLVLPDLLKVPSAIHLLEEHGTTVAEGLAQKKFANKIMRLAGGDRPIHGENPKVGGFGKYPSIDTLQKIIDESKILLPHAIKIAHILGKMEYSSYPAEKTNFMCVNPPEGKYGFYGTNIITSTGKNLPSVKYIELFEERLVPHSYAKRALHLGKPFTVGSIARINLLKDRLNGEAKKLVDKYYSKDWFTNPLLNNLAQAIENVFCFERIPEYANELIDNLKKEPNPVINKFHRLDGRGVGTVEAPRGLLVHDYTIENGLISNCNISTPTSMNLDDIERHLQAATDRMLIDNLNDKEIILNLELISRAYDPCISCSVHVAKINRT